MTRLIVIFFFLAKKHFFSSSLKCWPLYYKHVTPVHHMGIIITLHFVTGNDGNYVFYPPAWYMACSPHLIIDILNIDNPTGIIKIIMNMTSIVIGPQLKLQTVVVVVIVISHSSPFSNWTCKHLLFNSGFEQGIHLIIGSEYAKEPMPIKNLGICFQVYNKGT